MYVNPGDNVSFYNCFFPRGVVPIMTYMGRLHLACVAGVERGRG